MLELKSQVASAVQVIRGQWRGAARAGLILGTGIGALASEIEVEAAFDYESIPHFPRSTVQSHAGKLLCGRLAGVPIVAMQGRFHLYEGNTAQEVTFPVRVMRALGAELLIVSNACGGMNPAYASGDLMVIDDHINMLGANPLIGVNDDTLGPRFPDMSQPYDFALIERALEVARREGISMHRGVYVAVVGPNLETRAEYRFLRMIGGDVVGMSTVPEAIVAAHSGMRTLGLSLITDMCLPDELEPASLDKILAVAATAEPKMRKIVMGVLAGEPRVV